MALAEVFTVVSVMQLHRQIVSLQFTKKSQGPPCGADHPDCSYVILLSRMDTFYIASPPGGCLCEQHRACALFIPSAPQIKTLISPRSPALHHVAH